MSRNQRPITGQPGNTEVGLIVEEAYDGAPGLFVEGGDYTKLIPCRAHYGPHLIAHDLLEHPSGAQMIGTKEDELRAMGGMWFVRGAEDAQYRMDCVLIAAYIAEDMLRPLAKAGIDLAPCAEQSEPVTDKALTDAIWAACMHVGGPRALKRYYTPSLAYVSMGYRIAERRFQTREIANRQFVAVLKACWPWLLKLNAGELEYGRRLRLRYGRGEASIVPTPPAPGTLRPVPRALDLERIDRERQLRAHREVIEALRL